LAAAYKAINAPRGELGRRSLQIATTALAGRMIAILEGAAIDGQSIDRGLVVGEVLTGE
jgi:hypothetical protein